MVFKMGVFLFIFSILIVLMQPSTAASVQRRDAAVVKGDKGQQEAEGPKPEPEFDSGDAENGLQRDEKSHGDSDSVLRQDDGGAGSTTVPSFYMAMLLAALTSSMMFNM
ncbi:hypothetical protein RI129_004576 [Pyrocoelia pectoralis]|uniref:Uncharacterized protein n=1 Tax=Pyrocoelia pectoralis TaxID=417401 RepID=A0AAN7ZJG7_9COLE